MRKVNNITSVGILFIGAILYGLICYANPWLLNTWWIALPALLWFAYKAAPKDHSVPVIDYDLPGPEVTQITTAVLLTDNSLEPAVLHVCSDHIIVVTQADKVRVEMNELRLVEMQDLSNETGDFSGFAIVYKKATTEAHIKFAGRVSPWVTKGIVKLLLETHAAYYKGVPIEQLPYVEVANPHIARKAGLVHRIDALANKAVGDLN